MRFSKTNRVFHVIFLLSFGWIVLNVFLTIGAQNVFCILSGIALAAIAIIAYKLLEKHAKNIMSKIMTRRFGLCLPLCFYCSSQWGTC